MTDQDDAKAQAKAEALERLGANESSWAQHELVANYLRYGILTGDYPPGGKLPSTPKLVELYGVAPQTIKNANDMLADEGLVRSQRGSGIFVQPHRQQTLVPAKYKQPAEPGETYRWLGEAEKQGARAASTLLNVEEVEPPADVAEALGLAKKDVAVLRVQVLSINGEPAELVRSYYPVAIARGTQITEKKKIKGGTPRLLADMGYPPVRCVDKVMAILPTPEQVKALKMPGKLPALRTFRMVYSTNDRIIEVTEMVKASHLYAVEYEF